MAHRRGSRAVPFELGRELAALIPGAQLAALEGRMQPIYAADPGTAAATLLAFLREQNGTTGPGPGAGPLTARELEVAELIADGFTNARIARALGVSVRTVDAHVDHVRTKLGVRARAQIAVWARLTPSR